jgi:hypothetical protein
MGNSGVVLSREACSTRRRVVPSQLLFGRRAGVGRDHDAEYVALTKLQADAFVTLDDRLARAVRRLVATAPIDALRAT